MCCQHILPTKNNDDDDDRLCGFPPFYGDTVQEIFDQILKANYDYPEEYWNDISKDGAPNCNTLATTLFVGLNVALCIAPSNSQELCRRSADDRSGDATDDQDGAGAPLDSGARRRARAVRRSFMLRRISRVVLAPQRRHQVDESTARHRQVRLSRLSFSCFLFLKFLFQSFGKDGQSATRREQADEARSPTAGRLKL